VATDVTPAITSSITAVSVVLVIILSRMNRGTKRILIPDYRRGVLFVNGAFVKVLEAGSYRVSAPKQQLTIIDMRPQPILMERVLFQDALKNQGVVSLAVEVLVRDPHLAATSTRDQVKDAIAIVRDQLRVVLSQQIIELRDDTRTKLAASVAAAANTELQRIGMRVDSAEITELYCAPSPAHSFRAPETVQ
jgi:SPFH domain / Band 7 family